MSPVDAERSRLAVINAFPERVRWMLRGTPLDFDFARARTSLRPLETSEVLSGPIEESWRALLVFGERDYAEGGGSRVLIGVHDTNAEVYGLDVERDRDPIFFLNSHVDAFIGTFTAFDAALRLGTLPLSRLMEEATRLDPAFPRSEWRELAEYLRSGTE